MPIFTFPQKIGDISVNSIETNFENRIVKVYFIYCNKNYSYTPFFSINNANLIEFCNKYSEHLKGNIVLEGIISSNRDTILYK